MSISIGSLQIGLFDYQYVVNRELAIKIYLLLKMNKPLFLEGEAGVGKTELWKVLPKMLDVRLIGLQC
jgi:MoxR-like ATPase